MYDACSKMLHHTKTTYTTTPFYHFSSAFLFALLFIFVSKVEVQIALVLVFIAFSLTQPILSFLDVYMLQYDNHIMYNVPKLDTESKTFFLKSPSVKPTVNRQYKRCAYVSKEKISHNSKNTSNVSWLNFFIPKRFFFRD